MLENLPIPPDEEKQRIDSPEKDLIKIENNSNQDNNFKKKNFTGLIILGIICLNIPVALLLYYLNPELLEPPLCIEQVI